MRELLIAGLRVRAGVRDPDMDAEQYVGVANEYGEPLTTEERQRLKVCGWRGGGGVLWI